MKKGFAWAISLCITFFGFVMFFMAQMEISSNSRYTWRSPLTSYEAQVIMMKWIGILLLVSGLAWVILLLFQTTYTNRHTEDVTELTEKGGLTKCANCGLPIAADVSVCPRCGKPAQVRIEDDLPKRSLQFCTKCGGEIGEEDLFCPQCGNRINK